MESVKSIVKDVVYGKSKIQSNKHDVWNLSFGVEIKK